MTSSVLERLDWRRQVGELYDGVRAELYPHVAHAGWIAVRDRLYAEHVCSPIADRDAFRGLEVADYDPDWRVTARLEPADPQRITVPTSTGGFLPVERVGVARTPWGPLDVWELLGYGGGLWIPVDDRYLYDTAQGADLGTTADGELVLDLDFLYLPVSAHDPRLDCPIAPAGGRLGVEVPVGERLPT